ncbi:MAG: hypothetical protein ACYC4Q_08070 [Victivallaceae bacterium]
MKFLMYLILMFVLGIGIYWFVKNVFGVPEPEQMAATTATQSQEQAASAATAGAGGTAAAAGMPGDTQGVMAAQSIGNSMNQNSSPINKTKVMQRVQNINAQHNKAISKQ